MPQTKELQTVPDAEVIIAGRLTIGQDAPGRVKSEIQTEDQLREWAEALQNSLAPVSRENTASCGDGRPAVCTAEQLADEAASDSATDTVAETETLYQLFGGIGSAFSHAAVLANWSGFGERPKTFDIAKRTSVNYLAGIGEEDYAHTSTEKFNSPDNTDCGFEMGFSSALANTLGGDVKPVMETMAALNGVDLPDNFGDEDKELIQEILDEATERVTDPAFYEAYDPVANRDALKKKYDGRNLVVLKAEHDETHGHHEGMLVVVKPRGLTVNQKRMADAGKQVFTYHQGKAEAVSRRAGGSAREQRKLKLAFDFSSVVIAHGKLFAKNMPVAVVQ